MTVVLRHAYVVPGIVMRTIQLSSASGRSQRDIAPRENDVREVGPPTLPGQFKHSCFASYLRPFIRCSGIRFVVSGPSTHWHHTSCSVQWLRKIIILLYTVHALRDRSSFATWQHFFPTSKLLCNMRPPTHSDLDSWHFRGWIKMISL